jgi:hypothetical protein
MIRRTLNGRYLEGRQGVIRIHLAGGQPPAGILAAGGLAVLRRIWCFQIFLTDRGIRQKMSRLSVGLDRNGEGTVTQNRGEMGLFWLVYGDVHDQGDAKWIVIRTSLWGHNNTPCGRPDPGRPGPGRPGSDRPQGGIGVF